MRKIILTAALGLIALPAAANPLSDAPSVLHCFHPSGRFIEAMRVEDKSPGRFADIGADRTEVWKIDFAGGVSRHPYAMLVGVAYHADMTRVLVITDTAPFPPSDACSLRQWH